MGERHMENAAVRKSPRATLRPTKDESARRLRQVTRGKRITKVDGMKQTFTIPGRLDGLNKYTDANRTSSACGNRVKQKNQKVVSDAIEAAGIKPMRVPVAITYTWYEKPLGRVRDRDNVTFAKKFINDALVEQGILPDDGWNQIVRITDRCWRVADNPRIEVEIEEA